MKKQLKIGLLLVWMSTWLFSAGAQEINASVSLDTMAMPIGQQQTMRFEVSQPKGMNIQFPVFSDTIIDKVEIVDRTPVDTVEHGQRISLFQEYKITCFDSGLYYFKPFVFKLDETQGGGEIETNPLIMKVLTFEVDTAKMVFDIKQPMALKYELREVLPWIIGGVILALIIVAIIWLFRRMAKKEPIMPFSKPKPKEPSHVIALRELEALKAEKLWQTDRLKDFYTRLTDVLRVYIEDRYQVAAMEQTSEEILASLQYGLSDQESAMRNLKQILSIADLVKFAKMKPLANENDLCMMNAILFVEQTRPVEVKPIDEVRKEMEAKEQEAEGENPEDEKNK